MKKLYPSAMAALALSLALAGCMHLPPVNVGDPLQFDETTVSMVSLEQLAEPQTLGSTQDGNRPEFRWVDDLRQDPSTLAAMSDLIARLMSERTPVADPPPVLPPRSVGDEVSQQLRDAILLDYIGAEPGTVPDVLPDERHEAARRLIEEKKRELQERLEEEARQRQLAQLERQQEALRRLAEAALNSRRLTPDTPVNLPINFFIAGGSIDLDAPGIVRSIYNRFEQPLSIAALQLTAAEGIDLPDYPEQLMVHGLSVTVIAHEQLPDGGAVRPLIRFQRAVLEPQDMPLRFRHVGDGRYELNGGHTFMLVLDSSTTPKLLAAISNGHDIAGSADIAISLFPALAPGAGLDFTLRAGDALIRAN